MSRVEQAEAHLGAREIARALEVYAGLATADAATLDRVDGGRWMCHMLAGDYAAAWRCSDAIRGRGGEDAHRFWQGESIHGRRLMLRCLHGYGDTVMYLRWLPELRRRCREVTVQACPEMLPLIRALVGNSGQAARLSSASLSAEGDAAFEQPCPVHVVTWSAPGESDRAQWDVQVECAELPYLFRATLATLPAPLAPCFAEAEQHRLRMRLGERTRPRVGVVWTGSNYDPARSIPFTLLKRLFEDRSVEFWSLQAPQNNADWAAYCTERGWSERTFYTRDAAGGLLHDGIVKMAAFASQMDLVVTIDTMAAHVAASLGLPTWLLLKREADWRWMLEREESPWYPTMKIFRQRTAGDWGEVLDLICDALRDVCEEMIA